jgi:hypothetical protein
MNILGEGFNPIISKQIEVRQELFGAGFNTNNPRNPAFISYARTPTSFVRLMSSVSIGDLDALNNPYIKTLNLTGTALAQKAVLFGGVKGYGESLKGGITDVSQTGNQSVFNSFAYGWGGTEYGLRPMPGIQSANIKNESLGSLKTSTVQIKAWNKSQFEIIDTLYMRLGFYVLLEWGHTIYIDNSKNLITDVTSLENEFFIDEADVDYLQKAIIEKRYASCGNYDAILGRVVNFSWTFNKDGSYDITVIIRSLGDVIESLKANVLSTSPEQISDSDNLTGVLIAQQTSQTTGVVGIGGGEAQQQDQARRNILGQLPSNQLVLPPTTTTNTTTIPSLTWKDYLKSQTQVNKSNIHARLYKLQYDLDQQSKNNSSVGGITSYLSDYKLKDVAFATFKNQVDKQTSFTCEYYIRFGALLRIIQAEVIPTVFKGNTKYKLLNIDYDEPTNLINFIDFQVSTDPSRVLIKRDINVQGEIIKTFPGTTPFEVSIGGETYGKLMNVYLNYNYVFKLLDTFKPPSTKVALVDFLQALGDDISQCLGSINNIVPVIDEDTNTVKFIDQNLLYKKDSVIASFNATYNNILNTERGVFDLYGYNSLGLNGSGSAGFIKEFNLKTELTPQFASMITIAAAARSKVVGEDATALSRLNAGLTSSLFERIDDEYINITDKPISTDDQYKSTISNYITFLSSINMDPPKRPEWIPESFSTYTSVLNNIISYAQQLKVEATSSATTSTGFIPINVSLKMTGMSGMKIYQEFTLRTDFLPSNYQTKMSWLIKGVNHTIENNMWSSTIESLSLPNITTKPDSFAKLSQVLATPPTVTTTISDAADYWALIAIIALEAGNSQQGMADVAQSIYNRLSPLVPNYGSTIKEIITLQGQYEPTKYNPADWRVIDSKNSAVNAYFNSKNAILTEQNKPLISLATAISDINNAAFAQKNPVLQLKAQQIGSRTEFLGYYPTSGIITNDPTFVFNRTANDNYFYWSSNFPTGGYVNYYVPGQKFPALLKSRAIPKHLQPQQIINYK